MDTTGCDIDVKESSTTHYFEVPKTQSQIIAAVKYVKGEINKRGTTSDLLFQLFCLIDKLEMPIMPILTYIEGDLFAPGALGMAGPQSAAVFIPHVCNDRGGFGAGFVLALTKQWPETREQYLQWSKGSKTQPFCMGETQFVTVQQEPIIVVCNMVAQTLGGQRPLYYNQLAKCMDTVASEIRNYPNATIHCPLFGSKLAGGDWLFVEKLIEDCWLRTEIPVFVHYFNFTPPKNAV
jgi:O-acetyl-ADP-ribose deacetylase (regulator of RNase III)